MSEIKPQLDAHGIGLAGVGLEKLGVDDFVEGGYFKGGKSTVFSCNYCFHIFTKTHVNFLSSSLYSQELKEFDEYQGCA